MMKTTTIINQIIKWTLRINAIEEQKRGRVANDESDHKCLIGKLFAPKFTNMTSGMLINYSPPYYKDQHNSVTHSPIRYSQQQ